MLDMIIVQSVDEKIRNNEVLATVKPTIFLVAMVIKQNLSYFGHAIKSKDRLGKD